MTMRHNVMMYRNAPIPVSRLIPKLAGAALRQHGTALAQLVQNWTEIIGPDLAKGTAPLKLNWPKGKGRGGTLHLGISGSRGLLVQHATPQIIARINAYLGHDSIAHIRIQPLLAANEAHRPAHRTAPQAHRARSSVSLYPDRKSRLDDSLTRIRCDNLRAALSRLGQAVLSEG